MKKFRLFILIILIISCLPLSAFCADKQKTDGIVRVLLTRLQLTDTVSVSLDGSYTLNDIAFQRGSDLTISCKTGTLIVYYEGMALDAGKTLTLKRRQVTDGKENGIRFDGLYELHPGDLVLSMENGFLRAVLHAPVEEYLQGVVPYEMSNSFPLEALKAQAITARTYALRKAGSKQDYDLVDNTNDQAYMGIKAENTAAKQAITETEGMCGVYQGTLAECFYSASNGGQTELVEHVWGKGNYGYYAMTDDPYDLENPESMVTSATLKKHITSDAQFGPLKEYFFDQISEELEARGFDLGSGIKISEIVDITLESPKFPGTDSRLMTVARFTLNANGYRFAEDDEEELSIFALSGQTKAPQVTAAPYRLQPATATVEIEVPVFPTLEKALNMSISVTDNELFTVCETEDAFILEARRYGHGVGMSQRGAQQMAGAYQWNYKQILNFYYPGMTIEKYTYSYTLPAAPSREFLATPGPAATPTPRPTPIALLNTPSPDESIVVVTNIGVNSYLNLRAEASTASSVVKQLYYGQKLIVTQDLGDWLQVRINDVHGYVMRSFVNPME